MTDKDRIIRAALAWWRDHRPVGWTEANHFDTSTVNTARECEGNLARAVARWLQERKRP